MMASTETASVLVVDDVAENRDLLVRRLGRLGFKNIEQAENGLEALAAIEKKSFDLVLLDIMMPELDGFGVLDALKKDGRVNDTPVIVISALNEIEPVVRCVELGAEDFIFKPFNPTLLRARVLASLEKKQLRDRTREELKRKQAELKEARMLQLALAPPSFDGEIAGRRLGIEVLLDPAKEVGGDLVDYFVLPESNLVVLVLGDVSDKGAGSALMMARTHSSLRALGGRPDADTLFRHPEAAAAIVNNALAKGNANDTFVTLLLASLDVTTGRLCYVRAGHVPPLYRRADGSMRTLDELGGLPFGMMENMPYTSATLDLAAGDRLLAVTDGFTEAQTTGAAMFGDERIAAYFAGSAAASLAGLVSEVRAFEQGAPQADDMAALLVSFGAQSA